MYGFMLTVWLATGHIHQMYFAEEEVCQMMATDLRAAGKDAECQPYRPGIIEPDWSNS